MSDPNLSQMNDGQQDFAQQRPVPRIPRRSRSFSSGRTISLYPPTEVLPNAPPPSPSSPSYASADQPGPAFDANFQTPVGYDGKDLLTENNVVFLVPRTSVDGQPVCIKSRLGSLGEKTVHGGGSFNDESKFIVSVPRYHETETIITLENVKHRERYVCIDRRAKIKTRLGYKDSCDFFVYQVDNSSLFCFESAQSDGLYLGIKSNNSPSDTESITKHSEEAHFMILTDELSTAYPVPKLKIFETESIMNEVRDRTVIRLFSQRRYLGIDKRGKIIENHYKEKKEVWFILYDRGMGVVSMQSYEYAGFWLRTNDSQNKGELGSDALFRVKESVGHLVCFESLFQPGLFLLPPIYNTATAPSPLFTLEIVQPPASEATGITVCTS